MVDKPKRKVTIYNADGTLADSGDHNLIGKHVMIEGPLFTEEELEDSRRRGEEFMKGFKSHYVEDPDEIRRLFGPGPKDKEDGDES